MENNYKEFIQKIKYMVEYDTSKTREDNRLISERVDTDLELKSLSKKLYSYFKNKGMSVQLNSDGNTLGKEGGDDVGMRVKDGRLTIWITYPSQNSEGAAAEIKDLVSDVERETGGEISLISQDEKKSSTFQGQQLGHTTLVFSKEPKGEMALNEGVITEEDTPKEKGIEKARKVIEEIRAKHKNDKNWDDFIDGFVERINDAFNVNEGEEVNELMSKTTQDGWDEKTTKTQSNEEMEMMKVAKELFTMFKGIGADPALMSPEEKVIGNKDGDVWIQVHENPSREVEMWINFKTSNPTSDLNKFGPGILSKFNNVKLIKKDGNTMLLGLK